MKKVLYALIASVFFVACEPGKTEVQGNGVLDEKVIESSDFTQVQSEGEYNLVFVQDSVNTIIIEAEENIIPLIDVYFRNDKLFIENDDDYKLNLNLLINITIHHQGISEVDFSGAGSIDLNELISNDNFVLVISGSGNATGSIDASLIEINVSGTGNVSTTIKGNELDASVSGTGNFNFEGEANSGEFSISGVGNVIASELLLDNCYVEILGTGDCYFSVSDFLDVVISGVGDIYYKGDPQIQRRITGLGSIHKLD